MATRVIPSVAEARAAVNAWLITHLPERFATGLPDYDATRDGWHTSVRQETRYACALAYLRMVLGAFGVHINAAQLCHLTDCSLLGTDALQILEVARHFLTIVTSA
jgi:hypothetical protein